MELDLRAGDCVSKTAAKIPITFAHTTLTSDVDQDGAQLCEMARGAEGLFTQFSRRALRSACEQALPPLRSALHTDSFAVMAQTMKEMGAEESSDPKAHQLLQLVENCADPDNVEFDLNHLRIYSVGHIRAQGTVCPAYLLEVQDTQNDSRSYHLVGTGACAGGDPSGAAVIEPGTGNDPPGNRMHDRWAYTGEVPGKWVFRGQELVFVTSTKSPEVSSKATADAPMRPAAATSTVAGGAPSAIASSAAGSGPPGDNGASNDGADAGKEAVRAFYSALGRGDGAAANSLMSLEKRASPAFQPDAIEAFYGHMTEPLTVVGIESTGAGSYLVHYRYRKQSALCDGHAVATTEDVEGHALITRIKPIGNC